MQVTKLDIHGPLLFKAHVREDVRGSFCETYRDDLFVSAAGTHTFVQDNHSLSRNKGTIRGLHFQAPPKAQGKLVRVVRGSVYDVAVDVRRGSETYGRHIGVELSARNALQLWIPPGFLHGFCTLEDDVEFVYKVTAHFDADLDRAVAFDDAFLNIPWPACAERRYLSQKDSAAPNLLKAAPDFDIGA